jgi:succinate dehydrogenase/fumarate reductase cytochrome b subunit
MSPIKIIILIFLAFIIISLVSGLRHLLHRKGSSEKLARALTIRIGLSIALLMLIILSYAMGWLEPHSLLPVPVGSGN